MRIDLLVHAYPPDSLGGTELYTQRLAEGLRARGYVVRVLTYAPERRVSTRPAGVKEVGVPGAPDVRRLTFSLDDTDNPLRDEYDNPRVARYLRALWADERPDIVHVTHCGYLSSAPLQVAAELGIPTVVTLTDLWALCPVGTLLRHDGSLCAGPRQLGACARCVAHMGPRGQRFAHLADALPVWAFGAAADLAELPLLGRARYARWLHALRQRSTIIRERMVTARALLSPSRFQIAMLERNGYPTGAIRWMPHGIPAPETLRRGTTCHAPTMRLGYIGPLAPHKGAHLPLEAFIRLGAGTQATLTYWGTLPGMGNSATEVYGRALLEHIRHTPGAAHRGPFDNQEIARVLDEIDVLIVPSLWYENTPTIIYEALAHGTPVLGSDQGGVKELVELYAGGWLYPRGDVTALTERLRTLLADPASVQRGAEGIRPVPDMADHIAEVAAIYEQELHGR